MNNGRNFDRKVNIYPLYEMSAKWMAVLQTTSNHYKVPVRGFGKGEIACILWFGCKIKLTSVLS